MNKKTHHLTYYITLFVISYICLVARIDGSYHNGKYLYAEDGQIFLNQANALGISSIITPYAGYLHLYPRLFAFVAIHLPIQTWPIIFLVGWFIAWHFLIHTIAKSSQLLGFPPIIAIILSAVINCQPNNGEVFFTITNAQWWIWDALTIRILIDDEFTQKIGIFKFAYLTIFFFTGPFSIAFAPIYFYAKISKKNWNPSHSVSLLLAAAAITQGAFLVASGRASGNSINRDIAQWVFTFFRISSFESSSFYSITLSALFWILCIYGFAKNEKLKTIKHKINEKHQPVSLEILIGSIFINIFFAMYSFRQLPSLILIRFGSWGGCRYTLIPYTLIFILGFRATATTRNANHFLASVCLLICLDAFQPFHVQNFHFRSYAKFSSYTELWIPLNFQYEDFPGWSIHTYPGLPHHRIPIKHLSLDSTLLSGRSLQKLHHGIFDQIEFTNVQKDFLLLKAAIPCKANSDVGVEIEMSRDTKGWVELDWGSNETFTEENVINRWYPAGNIIGQYAFGIGSGVTNLRLGLDRGSAVISDVRIYCLE